MIMKMTRRSFLKWCGEIGILLTLGCMENKNNSTPPVSPKKPSVNKSKIFPKSEEEQFLINNVRDYYLKEEFISDFYNVMNFETKQTKKTVLFWEKEKNFFLIKGTYSAKNNELKGWMIEILTPDITISDESEIQKSYIFFKKEGIKQIKNYNCKEIEDGRHCKSVYFTENGTFTYWVNFFNISFDSFEHITKTPIKNIRTEIYYCYLKKDFGKPGGCPP